MSETPVECSIELCKVCQDHVFIHSADSEYLRVAVDDITYLKANRDCCTIFIKERNRIMVTTPMKDVLEALPQTKFIRVHRSYALNISYIVKIIGNQIELQDGTRVVIGRTYQDDLLSRFIFIGSRKKTHAHHNNSPHNRPGFLGGCESFQEEAQGWKRIARK